MWWQDGVAGAVASRAEDERRSEDGSGALQFCLLLYPKELEDEIIQMLDDLRVPGYTELPKMVGRGRSHKHFDNPVWPGATGAVFSILPPAQARALAGPFRALADRLESRSHGLYGLHMFTLPCQQVI